MLDGIPPEFRKNYESVFGPLPEPLNLTAENLGHNWRSHKTRLVSLIQTTPYLQANYERNFAVASQFVNNLPLVHAMRGIAIDDFQPTILGIKERTAIISREELEGNPARPAQIWDGGDWDKLSGLYRYVSASVTNVFSTLAFGTNLFVIDPKALEEEESFFVPAPDTVMYRQRTDSLAESAIRMGNLNDAVLSGHNLKDWLTIFIASIYEDHSQYLTEEITEIQKRLGYHEVPLDKLEFIQENPYSKFTPEVRTRRIPTKHILGFTVAGGTGTSYAKERIAVVSNTFPSIPIIDNPDPVYTGAGKVITDWFTGYKQSV